MGFISWLTLLLIALKLLGVISSDWYVNLYLNRTSLSQ